MTLFDVYDASGARRQEKASRCALCTSREATLTEDELSADRNRIVEALAAKIGGDIRL